jgi:hypothetical protein
LTDFLDPTFSQVLFFSYRGKTIIIVDSHFMISLQSFFRLALPRSGP